MWCSIEDFQRERNSRKFWSNLNLREGKSEKMFFRTFNNILVKSLAQSNRICARSYSALLKYNSSTAPIVVESNFRIHPCNKRDFIGWVSDKKDGYRTRKEESETSHLKFGITQLKKEMKLWKEEVKEHLRADPMMFVPPGNLKCIQIKHVLLLSTHFFL